VGVSERLLPFMPVPIVGRDGDRYHWLDEKDLPQSIGRLSAQVGNVGILLRAYITGDQLTGRKLGDQVTVLVDDEGGKYKEYKGQVEWISDKAEFTPKTIQTKDERANLVYAMKIRVQNDGFLKIGMYGEVKF
jgi:HlyD family secretion protein